MASMREIKLRTKSIRETKQITKAMKLISAAKLKKARKQLEQTLPFFKKVKLTIADILIHSGNVNNAYFDLRHEKQGKKKGYFVITGDKSLAGGYNHNIIKLAETNIDKDSEHLLMIAGHIGRNYFKKRSYNVNSDFDYMVQNPTMFRAREIAETLLNLFSSNEIDELYLVYTEMISSLSLEPKILKLLPLDIDSLKNEIILENKNVDFTVDSMFDYEPSPQAVFDVLIPKYIKGMVYGALVEAFTSEQSSRMTAMDNATSNADAMIQHLNLYYNRARQAAITQEISEIVGGAAALK